MYIGDLWNKNYIQKKFTLHTQQYNILLQVQVYIFIQKNVFNNLVYYTSSSSNQPELKSTQLNKNNCNEIIDLGTIVRKEMNPVILKSKISVI